MGSAFTFILALLKAIPTIKQWVDAFISMYVQHEISSMHENDKKAIRKAINEHDQRDLEKQIGNSNAGEESHLPGTELRDSLPGVLPIKR